MAQEIPESEFPQAPNRKKIEFSSLDFETPESASDTNRAGCSSEKFVKNMDSQASDRSIDLSQPSTSAAIKLENQQLKKKKKLDKPRTHDDNGLVVFSDNTPDPSQDTVP